MRYRGRLPVTEAGCSTGPRSCHCHLTDPRAKVGAHKDLDSTFSFLIYRLLTLCRLCLLAWLLSYLIANLPIYLLACLRLYEHRTDAGILYLFETGSVLASAMLLSRNASHKALEVALASLSKIVAGFSMGSCMTCVSAFGDQHPLF